MWLKKNLLFFQTKMKFLIVLFILLISEILVCELTSMGQCLNVKVSSGALRKRRHLTFPDGSDMILTISLVKAIMTHAPSGWNIALEIDVLFPLPDANFTNAQFRKKLHHRQQREFWKRLETAIDYQNIDGRACVITSICEAKSHLAPPGKSLVHDLLRAIFTAPLHEEDFRNEVANTYSELLKPNFCDQKNFCPFSLVHFVLSLNRKM